jgi:hypothetical protein
MLLSLNVTEDAEEDHFAPSGREALMPIALGRRSPASAGFFYVLLRLS